MYAAAPDDEWCDNCILEVELLMAEVEGPNGDEPTAELLRHYYTPDDLERRVAEYEEEYGLPSATLLAMWEEEFKPVDLPNKDRHLWLSYYRELIRMKRRGQRFRENL